MGEALQHLQYWHAENAQQVRDRSWHLLERAYGKAGILVNGACMPGRKLNPVLAVMLAVCESYCFLMKVGATRHESLNRV